MEVPQFCIILRGPAGAGKSVLAHEVQERCTTKTALIDTDIFNWTIVPGEDDKAVVYENRIESFGIAECLILLALVADQLSKVHCATDSCRGRPVPASSWRRLTRVVHQRGSLAGQASASDAPFAQYGGAVQLRSGAGTPAGPRAE